jgi:hypothetical protein
MRYSLWRGAQNKFDVTFVAEAEVDSGRQERSQIKRVAVNVQNTEGCGYTSNVFLSVLPMK